MIRTEHPSAPRFIFSTLLCGFVALLTCLAVKTWVGMYAPATGAWIAGLAIAFIPAYIMNKKLTASFRKIHFQDASEWRSLAGAMGLVGITVLTLLWFGAAGLPGTVAVEEAFNQAGQPFGLLGSGNDTNSYAFPCSVADGHIIWAPNVAWGNGERVLTRLADGTIKAAHLPRQGKSLSGRATVIVGPTDREFNRVMLCPVDQNVDVRPRSVVRVRWNGGRTTFIVNGELGRVYSY